MIDDVHLRRVGFPGTECGVTVKASRMTDSEISTTCPNCLRLRRFRDSKMVPHKHEWTEWEVVGGAVDMSYQHERRECRFCGQRDYRTVSNRVRGRS